MPRKARSMGKVIKIIRSFISAAILTLIVLPVALSLLLYLPLVQDFARRAAVGFLSDKLQTVVSVDKLHLKLFSRVTLDGFYVQDYHGDTLLYAGRIVVPLQSLNVFTGAVTLGHVGLEDVRFDLMQDSTRTSNLRQILQRIKRKEKREKKRKFQLHAAGVTIRDMDFRHRKFDVKPREYGVNFTDLDVRRFSLKVRDVSVEGDSVALAIDSLTLRERCGLHIRNLSTPAFGISGTGMRFDDLRLTTDESDVRMAYLYFDYDTWKGYKDFLNDVRIRSEFSRSTVSFRTIAYFAQGLRRWQTVLRDASGSVDGPVSAMKGRIGRATARSTTLSLRFGIDGLPEVAETRFSFDVSSLHTDAADIEYFVQDIAGRSLGKSLPLVERMGRIAFSGHFDGLFSDFRAGRPLADRCGRSFGRFRHPPGRGRRDRFPRSAEYRRFRRRATARGFQAGPGVALGRRERTIRTEFPDEYPRPGSETRVQRLRLSGHCAGRPFRKPAVYRDNRVGRSEHDVRFRRRSRFQRRAARLSFRPESGQRRSARAAFQPARHGVAGALRTACAGIGHFARQHQRGSRDFRHDLRQPARYGPDGSYPSACRERKRPQADRAVLAFRRRRAAGQAQLREHVLVFQQHAAFLFAFALGAAPDGRGFGSFRSRGLAYRQLLPARREREAREQRGGHFLSGAQARSGDQAGLPVQSRERCLLADARLGADRERAVFRIRPQGLLPQSGRFDFAFRDGRRPVRQGNVHARFFGDRRS